MGKLIIECDNANIDTSYQDNQIKIELTNPHMGFIQDLEVDDIISHTDNKKLLNAIIKNDPAILRKYLKNNDYGHFYDRKV